MVLVLDGPQLVGMVYTISEVPLPVTVTAPAVPMVATAVLLLLHVPPGVALVSVVTSPLQRFRLPAIGDGGKGLTVTTCVLMPVE